MAKCKQLNMSNFNENTMVGNFISPTPSTYALCWLETFEYVELWYFTQEGCTEAAQNQCTQMEDTFGLTKLNNIITLRPEAAIKVSKNAIPDIDPTWCQMKITKFLLIQHASKAKWCL